MTAHRTQQERSTRARALLLDATIDCLVELGYAHTTVIEISERAGVSRGAQQHHFTTKAELMTSALEHLFTRLAAKILDGDLQEFTDALQAEERRRALEAAV